MSGKIPKGKFAWTVKVGDKGQIVIPKQAREIFSIEPGDSLILLGDVDQGIAIPPKTMFTRITGLAFGEAPQNEKPADGIKTADGEEQK